MLRRLHGRCEHVDITFVFLVNYKQVLPLNNFNVAASVKNTIQQTGLSIIYTSLVLTAGFIIFCASSFGGTFALGLAYFHYFTGDNDYESFIIASFIVDDTSHK